MLELTIILDSNARNPFYFFFIIFYVRPLLAQTRWVKRTRRRNPFTLGDTEKLKLNFAWVVRLFSLSHWCSSSCSLSSPRAEHTTHCREEQHNSTHEHTHTHTREKRKLTKAMRMLMTHTAVVLSLSLSVSLLLCCPIGNWHEMTRTPTRRTLWQRRALHLLSENVCTFPIGMQHRMPMREWFHRRAAQKGTTKWSYDSTQNNKNKAAKQKTKTSNNNNRPSTVHGLNVVKHTTYGGCTMEYLYERTLHAA